MPLFLGIGLSEQLGSGLRTAWTMVVEGRRDRQREGSHFPGFTFNLLYLTVSCLHPCKHSVFICTVQTVLSPVAPFLFSFVSILSLVPPSSTPTLTSSMYQSGILPQVACPMTGTVRTEGALCYQRALVLPKSLASTSFLRCFRVSVGSHQGKRELSSFMC